MIAVDTNVLVAAHRADAPRHARAEAAVRRLAEGGMRWGLPWPCLHEFLAIATHPGIFDPPTPVESACDQVEAWMESPSVTVLGEPADHWPRLAASLMSGEITGPQVHDARVAAICLGHGVRELWTADRDFSLFPELRTANPLAG